MLSNKMYDVLKWMAQLLLPALGTLYFALSLIWGFPYGDQIVGTVTALDIFLGIILGVSANTYNKSLEPVTPGTPVPTDSDLVYPSTATTRPLGFLINITNATYDNLVWVAQYLFPAVGTLVFAMSAIWGWEWGGLVVGTLAALDVFLGSILGISTSQYKSQGNVSN